MKKDEFIAKYGEEAWEHHLIVSREWIKKNKQKHVDATIKCRKQKPEYYKKCSDENNVKYAELKKNWSKEHRIQINAKYRPELKRKHNKTISGKFKKYCSDALCKIENYYIALEDDFNGWCIHHRLELHPDNSIRYTQKSLKELNLYFNRPANELIFLRNEEHTKLHHLNSKHGSKYIDTNEITVNSVDNRKEYLHQYNQIRWRKQHE